MLLWAFRYNSVFSFLLGKHLRVKLLALMIVYALLFENQPNIFQGGCTTLHDYQHHVKVPISSHPHQLLFLCVYYSHFIVCECHLMVVLTCISLTMLKISDVHLSHL